MDLFEASEKDNKKDAKIDASIPLAERLRPDNFDDFVGPVAKSQSALFKNLRERNFLPNLILWGPPGTGKTTFAKLLSRELKAHFVSCSAIDTGAKELRQIGIASRDRRLQFQEKTLLFVDEIHRLNRAQQDVLLPFAEAGDIILIGATTENPSYELNAALLSRARVLVFEPLSEYDLKKLLVRASESLNKSVNQILTDDAQSALIDMAHGDARKLLNSFEIAVETYMNQNSDSSGPISLDTLRVAIGTMGFRYDKASDQHYDTISAFIKSVRGSDPDAAIYYLARMLEGGEDPVFIARRLVILASEDIGNADPRALTLAISGLQAVELIGLPEARITLAQVTTYLASAPKSNRSYKAIESATEFVQKTGPLPIPLSLRSSKTALNKQMGYGEGYQYSHESERAFIPQEFMPEGAHNKKFYDPSDRGFEKNIKAYVDWLKGDKKTEK